MPFVLFSEHFPDVADRETRSIAVPPDSDVGLPPGEYGFLEMYCDERGCDCRRVFFYVISRPSGRCEAVIAWGWEDLDFYAKWFKHGSPADVAELKGPILNPGSPGTKLAPTVLELVRDVLLKDSEYVERIKRHYKMFRDKVDQPRVLPRSRGPVRPTKRKPKKRRR